MEQKMYASMWTSAVGKEDPEIMLTSYERDSDMDWIDLGEVWVEFDRPHIPTEEEANNLKVKSLRKGREEIVEEYATKLANIDEQIAELLALPVLK